MKNIFLSVVVICALVVAGVGGTLATLTDTEESLNNVIEVGSLDLKVNDLDDDGSNGVGKVIEQICILPGTAMSTQVKVENEGCLDGYLYIVFKDHRCYNVEKEGAEGWIVDTNIKEGVARLKPEPEIISEYGGYLAQKYIPGIGRTGDNCCMNSHTWVTACYGDSTIIDDSIIGDLDDALTYVGVLPLCGGDYFIDFSFDVPQLKEGDFPPGGGVTKYDFFNDYSPFDHWPTNALQADGISFDILFILVDHQLSATEQAAIMADILGNSYTPVVK
jgi:predicted ribosomally synthesized peptide with SipW-like signal peptide